MLGPRAFLGSGCQEVPEDWLHLATKTRCDYVMVAMSGVNIAGAVLALLATAGPEDAIPIASLMAISVAWAAVAASMQRGWVSPRACHAVIVGCACVDVGAKCWARLLPLPVWSILGAVGDAVGVAWPIWALRAAMLWMLLAGAPTLHCVIGLSVTFANVALVCYSELGTVQQWYHRKPFIFVVYALFDVLLGVALHVLQHANLWMRFQAERAVAVEKEAMQALLGMLCDSVCWIAAGTDLVLRSDRRLEAFLGLRALGTRLSDHMPELERQRFRAATVDQEPTGCPFQMHPSTLLGPAGARADVDLFVVDRRMAFSEFAHAPSDLGFLVGIRFPSGFEFPAASSADDLESMAPCCLVSPRYREVDNSANSDSGANEDDAASSPRAAADWRPRCPSSSVPETLESGDMMRFMTQFCTRRRIEDAIAQAAPLAGFPAMCARTRATLGAAVRLVFDHAFGGALICIAEAEALHATFGGAQAPWAPGGGEGRGLAGAGGEMDQLPFARSCDSNYMTGRLQGVHISDARFGEAFGEFTRRDWSDRWPDDCPDEHARGQPKDGAFLMSASGYRIKCAAKLMGLRCPTTWPNRGTRHETALACAWNVAGAIVLVVSDAGSRHMVCRVGDSLQAWAMHQVV